MRPIIRTLSAVGESPPIIADRNQNAFKVALQLVFSGTAVASIQTTLDDPNDFSSTSDYNTNATWFDIDDLTNLGSNERGSIFYPVQAVRVAVTSYTSGDITLTYIQANDPS